MHLFGTTTTGNLTVVKLRDMAFCNILNELQAEITILLDLTSLLSVLLPFYIFSHIPFLP